MNHKHKISLCIVTYNNGAIIEETINSVVASIPEEYDYTFYVVDNHSSDNTVELIRQIPGNIKVIARDVNPGFGASHNQVLDLMDSEYHFVVNPDILVENKDEIRKMIERMDQDPQVGMLVPLILNPDLTIQHLCKTNPTVLDMFIRRISPNLMKKRQDRYMMMESGYDKEMSIEYASGCFMVFRSEVFKQLAGFDDAFFMYLEDADITRRVNEVSATLFYPHARIIHKWAREGHKSLKLAKITVDSMFVYFNKWGWKFF